MQSVPTSSSKSKSKFDELFQKVMEETNGALSDSIDKAGESGGLYQRGAAKEGVKLGREKRNHVTRDDLSDGSDQSQRSARPLLIEDLRDFEDLELVPTSSDPTTQVRRGNGYRNTPREADYTANSGKYSETFERDSEPSEIKEEILSQHSNNSGF